MTDLWVLAQQTAAWLAANPVTAVGIGVARAAGGDVWKQVKAKCQGGGKDVALAEFEANAEDPGNRAEFEGALHRLLKEDAEFARGLGELMEKEGRAAGHSQSITQGADGKAVASIGDGNKIVIG
jgi:hypothetical protein